MTDLPPRIFGRTNERVPPVWHEAGDGTIRAGDWLVLPITPDILDRRPAVTLEDRLKQAGTSRADVLLLQDILANDLKIGWPMHRMQQLRDRGLCRYFAIETHDPLEAEWITANAPVHAVVVHYTPSDMAVRYRTFAASRTAGVALIGRSTTPDETALHLGTPELCATIVASPPEPVVTPATPDAVEAMWNAYRAAHAEPAKLRSGHPPDYGT